MAMFSDKHLELATAIQTRIRERDPGQSAMEAMAEALCSFEVSIIGACAMIAKEVSEKQKLAAIGGRMMIDAGKAEADTRQWVEIFMHRHIVSEDIANKVSDLIGPAIGMTQQ